MTQFSIIIAGSVGSLESVSEHMEISEHVFSRADVFQVTKPTASKQ